MVFHIAFDSHFAWFSVAEGELRMRIWNDYREVEGVSCFISNIPNSKPITFFGYDEFQNYYRDCEMQTKSWLMQNLQEDSVYIDVGANVGILCLVASLRVGETGHVVAIEPTTTFSLLEKNLSEKKINSRITCLHLAASDKSGEFTDAIYRIWGKDPEISEYKFEKLDQIVLNLGLTKVDVVKIDTDGYELEVLRGAKLLIETFKPQVIIEINEALATRNVIPSNIFDFFINARYTDVKILDDHNYVFSTNWKYGEPWPQGLRLSTTRENPISGFKKGDLLTSKWRTELKQHVNLEPDPASFLKINADLDAWNYLAVFEPEVQIPNRESVVFEINGELSTGSISFICVDNDHATILHKELSISEVGPFNKVFVTQKFVGKLVLRTTSASPVAITINKISAYLAHSNFVEKNRIEELSSIKILDNDTETIQKFPFLKNALSKPRDSVSGWLMEQSSAWLIQSLLRGLKRRKHFEFGTWEGFGVCLALDAGITNIWTIDQSNCIDTSKYPSRYTTLFEQHGGVKEIGWLYKMRKDATKVIQIIENSKVFNFADLGEIKFDSIMIDGGHEYETVKSDTDNAIKMLDANGLIIWDDFNLGNEKSEAEEGVMKFITENIDYLASRFELYHLPGTQVLFGLRRSI